MILQTEINNINQIYSLIKDMLLVTFKNILTSNSSLQREKKWRVRIQLKL